MDTQNRLMKVLKWEDADRVPIEPPIPIDLVGWSEGKRPEAGWQAEDAYLEVAQLSAEHCDAFWNPPGIGPLFDRRFALISLEHIHPQPPTSHGPRHQRVTIVSTPRGDLRTVDSWEDGVTTSWYPEPLCKSREDAEKLLSVPFEAGPIELDEYFRQRERATSQVIPQVGISTPLVCAGRLFHFDQWLEWCASDVEFVEKMVAVHAERIAARLEPVLEAGAGPVFWFGGSEQATPPLMSRGLFERLVVRYDGPLMGMVKDHGCMVHVHCHGLVDDVLEHFIDMGADCLDPCEPPPDGDLDFADAKRRARGKTVLMGNIEFRHMEHSTPDEIEEMVRQAIREGGPRGLYLGLSATSISRLTPRYRDNALRYIEAGLEYGSL